MDSASQSIPNVPARKKVGWLCLFVIIAFGIFNCAFWPAYHYQQVHDPANFIEYAKKLLQRNDLKTARAVLGLGNIYFHPPFAEPYELYKKAVDEGTNVTRDLKIAFYSAWDSDDRKSALKKCVEVYPQPAITLQSRTNEALQKIFADFLAAAHVNGEEKGFSAAEQLAILGAAMSSRALFALDRQLEGGGLAPVDILASSGGGSNGHRAAHIFVDGREYADNQRGLHCALVDPASGTVLEVGTFDVWDSVQEANRMTHFLQAAPPGVIGIFAVVDDASVNMTHALEDELRRFGLRQESMVNRHPVVIGPRYTFAAIGVKSTRTATGTGLQAWSPETFQGHRGHPVACGALQATGAQK